MADKATKVRVLRAHEEHLPNYVILLSGAALKAATEGEHPWADADPDAVTYAEANEPQPETAPAPAAEAEEA